MIDNSFRDWTWGEGGAIAWGGGGGGGGGARPPGPPPPAAYADGERESNCRWP